jgi:hypothetical protein
MPSTKLFTLGGKSVSPKHMSLFVAVMLLAVLPFEADHLLFMLVGAAAYLVLHRFKSHNALRSKPKNRLEIPMQRGTGSRRDWNSVELNARRAPQKEKEGFADTGVLKKTTTTAPILAPHFGGTSWEDDVGELLRQITTTSQCGKTVAQIASLVKRVIAPVFPEADVSCFVCGSIKGAQAFGVAVPEVDIVIRVDPASVTQRRNQFKTAANLALAPFDTRTLQKYTMRVCTEKLVTPAVGLKFRRTAYRGDEPKATFLAPSSLGFSETSVPFDLSVNSLVPFYNAGLLKECGQLEPRARELILLVRRWAKDRGICHASKNHLPPYVWTILAIYYLQVGVCEEGPLLPPVESFSVASVGAVPKGSQTWSRSTNACVSVGSLFKAFFRFYANFSWRDEAVGVRTGKRGAPAPSLPFHITDKEGAGSEVGPTIEDPFVSDRNLATCLTAVSFMRLREELVRADALCAKGASLTVLLEPWAPPEFGIDGVA